ncbi:hypothetical protein DEFDS_P265 (plasmid) [Deferribacter desulfuricans SSM1]|uniref:Uncharacterized protein n=1 Tax=Deferribacter desulfuricans (strain DSM 14783 / JCM 11476 / NBRC 101012 / SSM1) TaxID=639282 RepID=D3PF93_DEFDS|nr:hypothetical protein [Deferribacter desulfuricans]BAI81885.1 hypothetical protein DEFDS_P265 [Deferribacter desulfuricans SSM1]
METLETRKNNIVNAYFKLDLNYIDNLRDKLVKKYLTTDSKIKDPVQIRKDIQKFSELTNLPILENSDFIDIIKNKKLISFNDISELSDNIKNPIESIDYLSSIIKPFLKEDDYSYETIQSDITKQTTNKEFDWFTQFNENIKKQYYATNNKEEENTKNFIESYNIFFGLKNKEIEDLENSSLTFLNSFKFVFREDYFNELDNLIETFLSIESSDSSIYDLFNVLSDYQNTLKEVKENFQNITIEDLFMFYGQVNTLHNNIMQLYDNANINKIQLTELNRYNNILLTNLQLMLKSYLEQNYIYANKGTEYTEEDKNQRIESVFNKIAIQAEENYKSPLNVKEIDWVKIGYNAGIPIKVDTKISDLYYSNKFSYYALLEYKADNFQWKINKLLESNNLDLIIDILKKETDSYNQVIDAYEGALGKNSKILQELRDIQQQMKELLFDPYNKHKYDNMSKKEQKLRNFVTGLRGISISNVNNTEIRLALQAIEVVLSLYLLSLKFIALAGISTYYRYKVRDLINYEKEYRKQIKEFNKAKKDMDNFKNILQNEISTKKVQQIIKNKQFFEDYYVNVKNNTQFYYNKMLSDNWLDTQAKKIMKSGDAYLKYKDALKTYRDFIIKALIGNTRVDVDKIKHVKLDIYNNFYRSVTRNSFVFNMLNTFWNTEKVNALIKNHFPKELQELLKNKEFNNYFEVIKYLHDNKSLINGKGIKLPSDILNEKQIKNIVESDSYKKLDELSKILQEKIGKNYLTVEDINKLPEEVLFEIFKIVNSDKAFQTGEIRTSIFQKGELDITRYFDPFEFNNNVNNYSNNIMEKIDNIVFEKLQDIVLENDVMDNFSSEVQKVIKSVYDTVSNQNNFTKPTIELQGTIMDQQKKTNLVNPEQLNTSLLSTAYLKDYAVKNEALSSSKSIFDTVQEIETQKTDKIGALKLIDLNDFSPFSSKSKPLEKIDMDITN